MLHLSDEINNYNFDESQDYYKMYFDIPTLSDKQKQDREEFSKEIEDILILVFLLLIRMLEEPESNIAIDEVIEKTKDNYKNIINRRIYVDKELSDYVDNFSETLVNNTLDNFKKKYTFSQNRIQNISVNESESIENYIDYKSAMIDGKTKKTWITTMDGRERKTHMDVNGATIPIAKLFDVGEAQMRYPHDIELAYEHPEELINCRCSIIYT